MKHSPAVHPKCYGFPGVIAALRRLDPFQRPQYEHTNRDLCRLGYKELEARSRELHAAKMEGEGTNAE